MAPEVAPRSLGRGGRPARAAALLVLAFLLPLGCSSAPAPEGPPPPPTPRDAALAAFAAYDARDWQGLAAVVHPAGVAGFRAWMLAAARGAAATRVTMTAAAQRDTAASDSAGPAAAWPSIEALERDPAESTFVRYVRGSFAYLQRYPEFEPHVSRQILGEVSEGDSTTHVVYRETTRVVPYKGMRAREGTTVELLTVRRVPGGWRPMLNYGLMAPRNPGYDVTHAAQ